MVANAAWNNNAVDYVTTHGEKLKYLDGAFWFAQYGVAGGTDSVRYAILGFKTSTTFGGSTYSFSSKVGGSFKLVDERTSDGKVYSLWKIDYNTVIARLKSAYPSTDFSSLSSQSVDSSYEFNAIMSIKKVGNTSASGSIDDTGKVLTSPVYTTKEGILGAATWYDPAPTEIGRLFGIKTSVAASVKPAPIKPNLTHFRFENYDYKDPNSETYWVKPTTVLRVIDESGVSTSTGVYPEVIYVRIYKSTTSNNRTFYIKKSSPKTVYYWDSGSPGNITYTSDCYLNSYASTSVNYICGDFRIKLPEDGITYGFQYTSTYNGQGPAYLETNKKVKVDGKAPSISGANNFGWSSSNGSINITASDSGSGVASIKLYKNGTLVSTSTSTSLSYTNTSEGTTTFKVEATDRVGNMSTATFTHYIDKTLPTVTINTTANQWKNSNITATISSSDSISGVKTTQYKLSGATTQDWTTYTGTITISNNGATTISARAYDNTGNVSSTATATVYVDKVIPTISMNADASRWINAPTQVTMSATDGHSGVNRIEYSLSGATSLGWTKYSNAVTISNDGKTTVYAKSYDNVGNVSSQISKEIWMDRTAPTVSISTTRQTWKNTAIGVSISASDSVSYVAKIEYKLTGAQTKDWTTYTGAFNITANGKTTIQARSYDAAGNVSAIDSAEVWYDDIKPTVSISTIEKTWKNTAIGVSISASDSVSYITKIEYKLTGAKNQDWTKYDGTFYISTNGKTTIQARSYDAAGNVSNLDSAEVWYDDVAPTANFSVASATVVRDINVNVSSLYDAHCGLNYVILSNFSDFSSPTKYSVAGKTSAVLPFTLDKKSTIATNYTVRTIYIRIYDNIGNFRDYTVKIKLDPAKPAPPTIHLPNNSNTLYITNEPVKFTWTHNNGENEFILVQTQATLVITNMDTNKSETVHIKGEVFEYETVNLDPGQYSVSITTNNFGPHTSNPSSVIFRYNKFYNPGLVRSIVIKPKNKVKYIGIATKVEIPEGCVVEGKVYYKFNADGSVNYSVYKPFTITKDYLKHLLRFDEKISALQIDLVLRNVSNPYNPYISPILDNLTVYAK